MRKFNIVKPYSAGSKGQSLAMVIPSEVVRKLGLTTSTPLVLTCNSDRHEMTLKILDIPENDISEETS